jgi:hypothetical protein
VSLAHGSRTERRRSDRPGSCPTPTASSLVEPGEPAGSRRSAGTPRH